MSIKVRHNGLEVDGNLVPLISGSVHYWRLDPEKWSRILDRVKELGFGIIETYVPWSVHEPSKGEFEFGRRDPAKNLDRFLGLAAEKGLKALVRPGPQINSELADFGYPWWVLEQERLWARDSEGAPMVLMHQSKHFKVPSYAAEGLLEAYEPFLAHLAPILQKHLHPHGPILAIQVDNEASYFFRTGTYDLDYCDASISLYRHFLELKYRNIRALNDAQGTSLRSFQEAEPPRGPDTSSLPAWRRCLDWAEYKEYQLLWFLAKAAALFRTKGLGSVPLYHNFFGTWETPFNVTDIEKDGGIDFCGIDAYPHKEGAGDVVDLARYLSTASIFPYIPEFGAGCWPLGIPARDQDDHAATILAPLMGGARGMNFYMLVERERWVGSPLSAEGEPRPELCELYRRFHRFLQEVEWTKSFPQNPVVLLESREVQLARASLLRPGHFAELGYFPRELWELPSNPGLLAPGTPGLEAVRRFHQAARAFLREQNFSYALGDSAISADKLRRYSAALLSAWGFWEEGFARRLRAYVEAGGQLLLGPQLPALNSRFEKLRAFEGLQLKPNEAVSLGEGRMVWLPEFDPKAALAFLRKARVLPEVTLSDGSLDLALHKSGGRSLLFLRNPHAEERTVTVFREGKFVLKPLWTSGKFLGAVEEREVKLLPHEIKVWELIPC